MEMTEDCSDPLEAVFNNSDPLLPLLLAPSMERTHK